MIPLAEAQAAALELAGARPVVEVGIDEALGAVLAAPVVVADPLPPFDNTGMDGFAVRSVDTQAASRATPVTLSIVATIAAGHDPNDVVVTAGTAARIMTGAPIPKGADAIAIVEDVIVDGSEVHLTAPIAAGTHVRRRGSDAAAGERVLAEGTPVTPAVRGLLASLGVRKVFVHRRPRVAVFSTGDELTDLDPLPPGKIHDSNRPALLALVAEAGGIPSDLGAIPDDPALLGRAFDEAAASADLILTSGGVSVGDFDYTKQVLAERGTMRWMQVAIKPAKPLAIGRMGQTPVIGLPGNPVSSIVSFELFARPLIRKMLGARTWHRPVLTARALEPITRHPDGKLHLVRARAHVRSGELVVEPYRLQGSHVLSGLAGANVLALVPDGDGVAAGEPVRVLVIGELDGPAGVSIVDALEA
ncbi:molybdenum cofactor synthesis domain protein [Acidimicrobium ferrooxidans DSM 10331]|uniref:Molybdopterin molybdenumtransferase n=1 Tax=Acidimicrobium ferrooxidans (strain DSM 10331 / JCM 15462 / NBRC 103882 / ICP) TaxID=525909 RepID=C7M359_ACIFD|nr:gephyrin-like molybdotransferase Glp [Acidimicrobium ferrooxidans]ACU53453.1 molybdenum cofactor synthesis domain protein [Acidimicrobium ferrooxidans DSM 10331]